jgi:hypothetical protein
MRLIDAERLKNTLYSIVDKNGVELLHCDVVIDAIDNEPEVENVRKINNGYWVSQNMNKYNGFAPTKVYYYPCCSECGYPASYTNYCPNCGAVMSVKESNK